MITRLDGFHTRSMVFRPTEQRRQSLSGLEEFSGSNAIVIGGIDGNINEGPPQGVEPSSIRRNDGSGRHFQEWL